MVLGTVLLKIWWLAEVYVCVMARRKLSPTHIQPFDRMQTTDYGASSKALTQWRALSFSKYRVQLICGECIIKMILVVAIEVKK